MDTKEIGTIIRERRKHLGVNQQTLADLAGVGLNTLVAIERGEGNPQLNIQLPQYDIRVTRGQSQAVFRLFLPTLGTFYSQPGNVLFPRWECNATLLTLVRE